MRSVKIHPVADAVDRRKFIEFPYEFYRHDAHWVAPLRIDQKRIFEPGRHPFFEHAKIQSFLGYEDGELRGRVSAIHDLAMPTGFGSFGFFECAESERLASALLEAAQAWLSSRGVSAIRGPFNPSINYECGLLIDGFDSSPAIMTTYNPSYYARLIETAGFIKVKDLFAYQITASDVRHHAVQRALRVTPSVGIRVRMVQMSAFEREVESVWEIYNSAWKENWGSAPMTRDELRLLARDLKPIIEPKLTLFVESAGEPVGFALAVPDLNRALKHARGSLFPLGLAKVLYNKRKIRAMRVIALGIVDSHRNTGAASLLYATLIRHGLELGYREAECSWVLEDNRAMNRSLCFLGASRQKTYRIYEKSLV